MSRLVWGISIVVAFTVMLTAKVFEIGIGASLSWWLVFLPIYGPFALGLSVLLLVGSMIMIMMSVTFVLESCKQHLKKGKTE